MLSSTPSAGSNRAFVQKSSNDPLPPELIIEIFHMARENYPCEVKTSRDRFNCPFVLSRVCRRWREVSLHEPELWVHIHLGDDTFWEENAKPHVLELNKQALHRSGESELDIVISFNLPGPAELPPNGQLESKSDLLDMISSSVGRWRTLIVSSIAPNIMFHVGDVLPRSFPRLRRLEYRNNDRKELAWPCLGGPFECPQLRELVLHRVGISQDALEIYSFPLVESVTSRFPMTTADDFVRISPNMKHIHIDQYGFGFSGVPHLPNAIRSLSLGASDVNIRDIFTMMAPELRVLAIECNPWCRLEIIPEAVKIPWDWGVPKLKTVILNLRKSCPTLALMPMIDHLPNVRHWILRRNRGQPPSDSIVEILAGHIADRVREGATITIERPVLRILKRHVGGKTASIRLYRDEFPSTNQDLMKQIESLRVNVHVGLVVKPKDVQAAALRECDDEAAGNWNH